MRVRRKLLQLARSYGRVARDGVRIDFPINVSLLAEMIGSSRETVTRSLDELQRSGFVADPGTATGCWCRPSRSWHSPADPPRRDVTQITTSPTLRFVRSVLPRGGRRIWR